MKTWKLTNEHVREVDGLSVVGVYRRGRESAVVYDGDGEGIFAARRADWADLARQGEDGDYSLWASGCVDPDEMRELAAAVLADSGHVLLRGGACVPA